MNAAQLLPYCNQVAQPQRGEKFVLCQLAVFKQRAGAELDFNPQQDEQSRRHAVDRIHRPSKLHFITRHFELETVCDHGAVFINEAANVDVVADHEVGQLEVVQLRLVTNMNGQTEQEQNLRVGG